MQEKGFGAHFPEIGKVYQVYLSPSHHKFEGSISLPMRCAFCIQTFPVFSRDMPRLVLSPRAWMHDEIGASYWGWSYSAYAWPMTDEEWSRQVALAKRLVATDFPARMLTMIREFDSHKEAVDIDDLR